MLGVVGHRDRLVDEKHWDAVLDAIGAAKSRVVEVLVTDQQKGPAVLRADQNAQQFVVDHDC